MARRWVWAMQRLPVERRRKMRCWTQVTRHTPHVTRHTSHATRHTPHVTRHTSHVTRHTLHVITSLRHTPHLTHQQHLFTSSIHQSSPVYPAAATVVIAPFSPCVSSALYALNPSLFEFFKIMSYKPFSQYVFVTGTCVIEPPLDMPLLFCRS